MEEQGSGGVPISMAGLGNFKGVMLCSRPTEGPGQEPQKPFVSAVPRGASEQLGTQPVNKRLAFGDERVKLRGPSAALRRHCHWIKELQEQVHEDQRMAEEGSRSNEERHTKLREGFARQREAIRQIKKTCDKDNISREELESCLRPKAKKPAASKPMWAMTENEREDFEDGEAEDLINFAENLDFDGFIQDLEFRQCLQAVRDRAKKLQREQDAFKEALVREFNSEVDGSEDELQTSAEAAGGRRIAGGRSGSERPDWDSSTAHGEDFPTGNDKARSVADKVWKEGSSQLRGVHSKSSVQKLVKRQSAAAES